MRIVQYPSYATKGIRIRPVYFVTCVIRRDGQTSSCKSDFSRSAAHNTLQMVIFDRSYIADVINAGVKILIEGLIKLCALFDLTILLLI